MIASISGPWAVVLRLQQFVSRPFVGAKVFGCDEALEVVLDGIETGAMPEAQTIKNLCANRAGKDRNRRRLARRFAAPPAQCGNDATIDMKRLVAFVSAAVGQNDFAVLSELVDSSYEEVATARNISIGTLKARVARARARVREACARDLGITRFSEAA